MENCGAYLFEWRPIDCGNGNYFAILVGGNTLQESNVILNRGYDYAYTFDPMTYQYLMFYSLFSKQSALLADYPEA